jgi:hypothetical protein
VMTMQLRSSQRNTQTSRHTHPIIQLCEREVGTPCQYPAKQPRLIPPSLSHTHTHTHTQPVSNHAHIFYLCSLLTKPENVLTCWGPSKSMTPGMLSLHWESCARVLWTDSNRTLLRGFLATSQRFLLHMYSLKGFPYLKKIFYIVE